MGILKSAVEKTGAKGKFWVCVIGNEEVLAYDAKILEYEGKEVPFEIGTSGTGKKFVKFPREGGFKGGAGGGWKGKSDKEIYTGILTMSMAYAKDLSVVSQVDIDINQVLINYRAISQAILADLAKLVPDTPKQTEPPKTETKASEKPPQETSRSQADKDTGTMTVKDKLKKEMWQYLVNKRADTEEHFKTLLIELTEFEGKNRDTGELTGKMVFVDDMNDKKFSDKWAQTAVGNLRKLVEQEEHKSGLKDDDIPY